jgi:serine/threonine protein kinase
VHTNRPMSSELGLPKPATLPGSSARMPEGDLTPDGKIAIGPGSVVGGYRIERQLAEGGMGTVFIGQHVILPRRAAIKILRPELTSTVLARESLLHEGRILETLLDPRVARVYDAGFIEEGRPWVAMELLEGECLADLVVRQQRLTVAEVAQIINAIVEALGAAHARGVVHSDVKPENIMIKQQPGGPLVKMIDWGISRVAAETKEESFAVGTPHYMAPEQVRGEKIDQRADIYALGILAYELLAGKTPFNGDTPADIALHHLRTAPPSLRILRRDVPPAIESLVNAMLAKEASGRPSLDTIRACFGLVADSQLEAMESAAEAVEPAPQAVAAPKVEVALDVPAPDEYEPSYEMEIDYSLEGDDVVGGGAPRPRWTPPHGRATTELLSLRETMRFGRILTAGAKRDGSVAGVIRKVG